MFQYTGMEAWKSMTKEELEHHYSPSRWTKKSLTPDQVIDEYVKNITEESKFSRDNLLCTLDVPYGTTSKQKLNIFEPRDKLAGSPVFLYIHGGYWQFLSRDQSSFMAGPLVDAGITCICIGYDIAPDASMDEIVAQVNRAVDYVCAWARRNGTEGVYIGGHSAGGHLVAMVLANVAKSKNADLCLIKGAFPMSGVYDLRPLVNTYVNDPIRLTEDTAWSNSPINYIDDIIAVSKRNGIKIKVAVGGCEPPEFKKQSECFYDSLKNAGVSVQFNCVEDEDHFTVNDKLCQKDFVLTKELIKLIIEQS